MSIKHFEFLAPEREFMAKKEYVWARVKTLTSNEKSAIADRCERFIIEEFKPLVLPEIHPTEFNYIVDILGKWRGNKYSFIACYRSGFPDNKGEEFNHAFARFDLDESSFNETRFDIMWHRHTGQWWRLHTSKTLEESLKLLKTTSLLHP